MNIWQPFRFGGNMAAIFDSIDCCGLSVLSIGWWAKMSLSIEKQGISVGQHDVITDFGNFLYPYHPVDV